MRISRFHHQRYRQAYSIVEVLVAGGMAGILFVVLYTGLASGFGMIQHARENLRASQVLLEKVETVRLLNWDQINTPGFIPATFVAPFISTNSTCASGEGFTYEGTMEIADASVSESYHRDLKQVKITVAWTSGRIRREREMSTFVANHGLQNYIY